jgi:hypothetical protein
LGIYVSVVKIIGLCRCGADRPTERAHDKASHSAMAMRPAKASEIRYAVTPASGIWMVRTAIRLDASCVEAPTAKKAP